MRVAGFILLLAVAGVAAGAPGAASTKPAATKPTTAPTTAAATQQIDYYAMTPEEFFKLPAVNQKIPKDPKAPLDLDLLDAAVFHSTNIARVKNDRKPFQLMLELAVCASEHSKEMAALNYFSHTSPVEENKTIGMRGKAVGLENVPLSENIHARQTLNNSGDHVNIRIIEGTKYILDAKTGKRVEMSTYAELANAAVEAWLNSPGHRATMLNPDSTHLGTGAARGPLGESKQDSIYFTQNFSTKK